MARRAKLEDRIPLPEPAGAVKTWLARGSRKTFSRNAPGEHHQAGGEFPPRRRGQPQPAFTRFGAPDAPRVGGAKTLSAPGSHRAQPEIRGPRPAFF